MTRTINCRRVAKYCNQMTRYSAKATAEQLGLVTDGRFLIFNREYADKVGKYLVEPEFKWMEGIPTALGQKQISQALKDKCKPAELDSDYGIDGVWFFPPIVDLITKLFPKAKLYYGKRKLSWKIGDITVAVFMGCLDSKHEYYKGIK